MTKIVDGPDVATKIGEIIGTLVAISVHCLMAYGLYFGLFH